MKEYLLLIILICSFANAQNIDELYTEKFKSDWQVYQNKKNLQPLIDTTLVYTLVSGRSPQQEIVYQARENLRERAESIARVFSSLNIKLEEVDSLVFIEQRSTHTQLPFDFSIKGALVINDTIHGFYYDAANDDPEIDKYDYFEQSEKETIHQAKQIIGKLILTSKTNLLDTLGKVETKLFEGPWKNVRPETEFEVLIYNRHKENELRRIYLHETLAQLLNQ